MSNQPGNAFQKYAEGMSDIITQLCVEGRLPEAEATGVVDALQALMKAQLLHPVSTEFGTHSLVERFQQVGATSIPIRPVGFRPLREPPWKQGEGK